MYKHQCKKQHCKKHVRFSKSVYSPKKAKVCCTCGFRSLKGHFRLMKRCNQCHRNACFQCFVKHLEICLDCL